MEFDELSNRVIGCAIEVHRQLGPGLLESAYQRCLEYEFLTSQIQFHPQKDIPIAYKGVDLDNGYRVDFLVENELILELKAVDEVHSVHEAQLLTYMKLARIKTGLLINFNVKWLKEGIRRFVL
jgi:GxxExxY protein